MDATLGTRTVPARGAALLLALALATPGVPALAAATTGSERVVVTGADLRAAAESVVRAGGAVLDLVPIANALVARLPRAARPYGVTVVPDRPIRVAQAGNADGPASTVRETLGLPATGSEGAGVVVAVVDTGVADVADLRGAVVGRVDVTGSGGGDGYGHGTFMAGLVAGSGAASGGRYQGVAPGAKILDVKVADASGATSLSYVLRGLQAVADDGRAAVLNLSLSSDSPLPWQVDPLTNALDMLWYSGVTVVVPGGNDGPDARTISSPGVDPTLLTVGALDEGGTAARADDTVPSWSSRGPAPQHVAKPDLVAPGTHVVSVRAPGSTVDVENAPARVGTDYFKGSGSSMATAVTSGAVAALLARRPSLTPDDVKSVLTGSAYGAGGLADPDAAGRGGLDLAAAYGATPAANQAHLPNGHELDGDEAAFTAFARAWAAGDYDAAARAWAQLSAQARAWAARAWAGASWTRRANSWSDAEWNARAWAARAWAGRSWTEEDWLARAWAGRAWADADWAARAWAARAWTARAWSARAWSGRAWAEADWEARAWSARAWSARAWSARAWTDAEWEARAWSARAWTARAWTARAWTARAWTAARWGG